MGAIVHITRDSQDDQGPITVVRRWSKDGSSPAGTVTKVVLRGANEQCGGEIEDGMTFEIVDGDLEKVVEAVES